MEHDVEKVTANKDAPACADSSQGADSGDTLNPRHVSLKQASSHLSTGNDISLRAVAPVHVSVRSLAVDVDVSPSSPLHALSGKKQGAGDLKTILHDVSADMPSGTLTAIIGGSGSGKTTLLNLMSNRMHGRRLHISGATLFNGHDLRGDLSAVSAYVMQTDVLQPTLTVRETLQYAADLRLPASVDKDERRRVVDEVILELGLKEAADTRIGNNVHKGCSGGEKRRTSIGVQLLSNPSVLFLDEPTTGLDATSAFQLVLHQPRSEIWNLFDNLVLLTKGYPAYSGPAADALPYFAGLGYELPPFVNPAEHLIDIVAVDIRSPELEEASTARVEGIKAAWSQHAQEQFSRPDDLRSSSLALPNRSSRDYHAQLGRQIRVLTARTWVTTIRDPMGMLGSFLEAIAMSIITGYIFFQLGEDQAGIRSRQGALYIASALQGYLILQFEVFRLTIDIELFDRERGEGVVSVPGFLISRRLARLLIEDFPVPLLFSLIFYFMAGFRTEGTQFMTFFAVILLEQYIAVCFAMTCVAVSRTFAGASLVANMAYTLQSMACGYFIQSNTIPIYVRWTKWTAYCFYAFGALAANEFDGHFYDCPEGGGPANPNCKQYTGEYIMEQLGFPSNWIWRPIIVLLAFVIAFYIGAGLILRYWKVEMQIGRARKDESDESAGKEKMTARSLEEVRTVKLRLEDYALEIEKRNWMGRKTKQLEVLKPVTTQFEPGVLNIIMGPSGSGKTTLLNSMGRRLKNSFSTKYHSSGQLLVNNSIPSDSVLESIISYVTQDDDALLSSLTVRETLRFAAGLRLPSWMPKEEKNKRAEDILLKMGLKDCADNLIGGELVKGISGGEKRRVTIAVQILTDPRVLLLDEPTSGLDAFTAASIIDVLRGLAEEGRTLILTIHQSRSDLFQHFGNILLLARGGFPVYAGPGKNMLTHFADQGFVCPRSTNPADFALDLITVDLQHETKEAASRAKVRNLVDSWAKEKPSAQDDNDDPLHRTSTTATTTHHEHTATPAELGSLKRSTTSFHIAYPLLVRRAMLNFWRQPPLMVARIMQVVGLGGILALFFAPLKNDYYSVQNRVGFLQEIPSIYFVGMLQNVAVYPAERDVFAREHDDGAYGVEAFFMQYLTIETPFEIVTSLIFAVLGVLAVGLPRTVELFFLMAFNCFCIVSCGESLGIMFNTVFSHTGFAVNITSVFLSVAQIMAGIMSINMPVFLQDMNYLSPIKYVIANLAPYSLNGVKFTCTEGQRLANGRCPIETGEEVLQLYALESGDARLNVLWLGVCAVVYRLLAYALLKARRERWSLRWWREE
ncbi:ABC transporter-like protein [Lasiodiplodia theobromae]|uniref:ABC transporter-like protein n=1 Tax=Lasiodiplodia theobromae TaxID=45133 RepID=UPI0015C302BD|nr:ABC transporter-like protein [Lasiodiplodia theobromae]KAF4536112.1 ABC transporter-like protein [Lasiodiplodia theobromae]